MAHFVYLIKTVGQPLYKIGFTNCSVSQRIAELQTASPYKLRYIHHISVKNERQVETYLHSQFAQKRTHGEWFKFDELDCVKCIGLMQGIEASRILEKISQENWEQLEQNDQECLLNEALDVKKIADADWYRWLPQPNTVISMLEQSSIYNLGTFVRSKLKKSETEYNRKAKKAIALFLVKENRKDLLEKYNVKLSDYGLE